MKRLVFTPGEPAGIGPDLAVLYTQSYLQQTASHKETPAFQLVCIADPDILTARATQLGLTIRLTEINLKDKPHVFKPGELGIIPVKATAQVNPGQLNPKNANYVLKTLDIAIKTCQQQSCHAMITGPVQKSVINDAGIAFSGHTEYLAQKTHTPQVVMMLATEGLRVALATTHIPLADVPGALTSASLETTLRILHAELIQTFNINQPRILVCGLNPHAGENGHLGREEIDIIIPTLQRLQQSNIDCQGPLPADTLFTSKYLEQADAVLAMYHDQGLPVLKYKGFGAAANITLGLPLIRTSVDHGTALDLAGTGHIGLGSLHTAIQTAATMRRSQGAPL